LQKDTAQVLIESATLQVKQVSARSDTPLIDLSLTDEVETPGTDIRCFQQDRPGKLPLKS
jgi:hypothetical protein